MVNFTTGGPLRSDDVTQCNQCQGYVSHHYLHYKGVPKQCPFCRARNFKQIPQDSEQLERLREHEAGNRSERSRARERTVQQGKVHEEAVSFMKKQLESGEFPNNFFIATNSWSLGNTEVLRHLANPEHSDDLIDAIMAPFLEPFQEFLSRMQADHPDLWESAFASFQHSPILKDIYDFNQENFYLGSPILDLPPGAGPARLFCEALYAAAKADLRDSNCSNLKRCFSLASEAHSGGHKLSACLLRMLLAFYVEGDNGSLPYVPLPPFNVPKEEALAAMEQKTIFPLTGKGRVMSEDLQRSIRYGLCLPLYLLGFLYSPPPLHLSLILRIVFGFSRIALDICAGKVDNSHPIPLRCFVYAVHIVLSENYGVCNPKPPPKKRNKGRKRLRSSTMYFPLHGGAGEEKQSHPVARAGDPCISVDGPWITSIESFTRAHLKRFPFLNSELLVSHVMQKVLKAQMSFLDPEQCVSQASQCRSFGYLVFYDKSPQQLTSFFPRFQIFFEKCKYFALGEYFSSKKLGCLQGCLRFLEVYLTKTNVGMHPDRDHVWAADTAIEILEHLHLKPDRFLCMAEIKLLQLRLTSGRARTARMFTAILHYITAFQKEFNQDEFPQIMGTRRSEVQERYGQRYKLLMATLKGLMSPEECIFYLAS